MYDMLDFTGSPAVKTMIHPLSGPLPPSARRGLTISPMEWCVLGGWWIISNKCKTLMFEKLPHSLNSAVLSLSLFLGIRTKRYRKNQPAYPQSWVQYLLRYGQGQSYSPYPIKPKYCLHSKTGKTWWKVVVPPEYAMLIRNYFVVDL